MKNEFEMMKSHWFHIRNDWVCKYIIGIVSDYFDFFKIKIKENSSVGNDTPHYSDQLNL